MFCTQGKESDNFPLAIRFVIGTILSVKLDFIIYVFRCMKGHRFHLSL